jgi:hypothetical protein
MHIISKIYCLCIYRGKSRGRDFAMIVYCRIGHERFFGKTDFKGRL